MLFLLCTVIVDFSLALPGVSLARTRFTGFIGGDTRHVGNEKKEEEKKTCHLVNMLEYSFTVHKWEFRNIKRHLILGFCTT